MKTEDCLALANGKLIIHKLRNILRRKFIYRVYIFLLILSVDRLPDKNALSPPSTKGNEEYTQWLQTSLMDAGVRADRDLSPFLFTIRKYLEVHDA